MQGIGGITQTLTLKPQPAAGAPAAAADSGFDLGKIDAAAATAAKSGGIGHRLQHGGLSSGTQSSLLQLQDVSQQAQAAGHHGGGGHGGGHGGVKLNTAELTREVELSAGGAPKLRRLAGLTQADAADKADAADETGEADGEDAATEDATRHKKKPS